MGEEPVSGSNKPISKLTNDENIFQHSMNTAVTLTQIPSILDNIQ
jgi:hypothetical protein